MKGKKLPIIVFILLLFFFINGTSHKFYVSLCLIDHNSSVNSLEITMKIFTDDLEYAITGSTKPYGLGTEKEPPEADSILFNYIKKNFRIKVDGMLHKPVYIGKEAEQDVIWCYVEIENIRSLSEIEVTNQMLTELFDDQVNLVNIKYQGKKYGILLNRNKKTDIIFF